MADRKKRKLSELKAALAFVSQGTMVYGSSGNIVCVWLRDKDLAPAVDATVRAYAKPRSQSVADSCVMWFIPTSEFAE